MGVVFGEIAREEKGEERKGAEEGRKEGKGGGEALRRERGKGGFLGRLQGEREDERKGAGKEKEGGFEERGREGKFLEGREGIFEVADKGRGYLFEQEEMKFSKIKFESLSISRSFSGCHWTPMKKFLFFASIASIVKFGLFAEIEKQGGTEVTH